MVRDEVTDVLSYGRSALVKRTRIFADWEQRLGHPIPASLLRREQKGKRKVSFRSGPTAVRRRSVYSEDEIRVNIQCGTKAYSYQYTRYTFSSRWRHN
jgi:hypothetical protein